LNVLPNIRCIISIQINDLFDHVLVILVIFVFIGVTVESNFIKVFLIGFWTSDVEGFVEITSWILCTICFSIFRENTIIGYFKEFNFDWLLIYVGQFLILIYVLIWLESGSLFIETLNLWNLILRMTKTLIKSLIEILLTIGTQESTHGWLSHSRKTDWYQKELVDVRHLALW